MEAANEQGGLPVNSVHGVHRGGFADFFHKQEGNAIENQSNGNHDVIVKMGVHPIVKGKTQNGRGQNGNDDLAPQKPGVLPGDSILLGAEGIQFLEEQEHDSQNSAQLDHHLEHFIKGRADAQGQELFQENQMAGGGNGKPFGDALHDAENHRFQ